MSRLSASHLNKADAHKAAAAALAQRQALDELANAAGGDSLFAGLLDNQTETHSDGSTDAGYDTKSQRKSDGRTSQATAETLADAQTGAIPADAPAPAAQPNGHQPGQQLGQQIGQQLEQALNVLTAQQQPQSPLPIAGQVAASVTATDTDAAATEQPPVAAADLPAPALPDPLSLAPQVLQALPAVASAISAASVTAPAAPPATTKDKIVAPAKPAATTASDLQSLTADAPRSSAIAPSEIAKPAQPADTVPAKAPVTAKALTEIVRQLDALSLPKAKAAATLATTPTSISAAPAAIPTAATHGDRALPDFKPVAAQSDAGLNDGVWNNVQPSHVLSSDGTVPTITSAPHPAAAVPVPTPTAVPAFAALPADNQASGAIAGPAFDQSGFVPVDSGRPGQAAGAAAVQLNGPASWSANAATLPANLQVAVQMSRAAKSGESAINIQLHPAELGRVEVRLGVDSRGNTTARVTADSQSTLDLLQADRGTLARTLTDAGLKCDSQNLTFDLNQNSQQDSQNAFDQAARQQSAHTAAANRAAGTLDAKTQPATLAYTVALQPGRVDIMA